jgi:transcriptional regulator with XRE-family HTH domain
MNVIKNQAKKNNTSLFEISRQLHISIQTLLRYCDNYNNIPLQHIILMSALFGMPVEELVYMLMRNRAKLDAPDYWYLDNIRAKNK